MIDGGDIAFDRQDIPLQPVGLEEEEDYQPVNVGERLDIVELK